ncbi:CmcJ/NvfI family oxidoreductase [Agarilytica rhodophyticola]|uniref:CmcJ/NvfI family oxidoreductase n=1 Tax=Agarilytica rhodophyticola TaxID=1737490 RepID=UPI000B34738A|nr:CmcJ/NvfI family oxidoreductase [Agarilytica rhodophyticola]
MHTNATVNYHVTSPERQAYHIDVNGEKGAMRSPILVPTEVAVQDVRDEAVSVNFIEDSVMFVNSPTKVVEFDASNTWQKDYDQELQLLLKQQLSVQEVIIFDHTIRIDDPNSGRKPARNVHSDYSKEGAHKRLIDLVGQAAAKQWQQGHYAFINIWRPLNKPIYTAPLGFVRPSSVKQEDWLLLDLIYPDRVGQIMGLVANQSHQWFYLSEMTPEEVAVFNIYDNQGLSSIAHSALNLAGEEACKDIRTSLESRTLVRY